MLVERVIKKDIYNLTCEVGRLQDLIHHCWVHSGYKDCGKRQMTTPQKKLYEQTVKLASDKLNNEGK